MESRTFRRIWGIPTQALLISSFIVIINGSAAAEAPADVGSIETSTGTYEVTGASGSNRFVVWMDSVNGYEIFFRRSTDNGATWQPTVNLSNNAGDSTIGQIDG